MQIKIAQRIHTPGILDIYRPVVEKTHTSFEYTVPRLSEIQGRIDKTLAFYPWLVSIHNHEVSGYAYASRFRKRKAYDRVAEVSVYVHPKYQAKGVGTELYRSLLEILEKQGITQCIAGISLPNERSVRFHRKCGFKTVGTFRKIGYKFDRWYDVLFLQRALNEDSHRKRLLAWHEISSSEWRGIGVDK